ncbi:hypothetical protein [Herbaspirillum lusitanum]|nr:hypothetical protein [Herbaspirillum lusitanum]MCW5299084.1 hypothetical protein [Herbaspirillum lusitanum]
MFPFKVIFLETPTATPTQHMKSYEVTVEAQAVDRILFAELKLQYRTAANSLVGQAASTHVQGSLGLSCILEFLQIKRNVSYSQTPVEFFMLASTN